MLLNDIAGYSQVFFFNRFNFSNAVFCNTWVWVIMHQNEALSIHWTQCHLLEIQDGLHNWFVLPFWNLFTFVLANTCNDIPGMNIEIWMMFWLIIHIHLFGKYCYLYKIHFASKVMNDCKSKLITYYKHRYHWIWILLSI